MAGPIVLSTGIIDNRSPSPSGKRPTRSLVIRVENNEVTSSTSEGVPVVVLEVFTVNPTGGGFGTQSTYVLDQVSLADVNQPSSTFTIDNVFADLDTYGVRCTITTTGSTIPFIPTVTVFSQDAQGNIIASNRLYLVTISPTGPGPSNFIWGQETIIWADSSAPGPGDGTPSDPYNSLQAAITAATNSPFAVAFGMRARLIILIAANSVFNEDIVIPPARHVQLLGLGPWVLGNADLANFGSSVPRNITIQTSQDAENVYLAMGPAFDARPVTVIGTFDNGTSVSTHTNYTNGAIISGNVIFLNTAVVDPFTTIEFQLLNARVVGSIIPDPANPHLGITNTYMYNSRINVMNNPGGRIQRMVDSQSDGLVIVDVYSEITNCSILGDVTADAGSDVPPIGVFNTQFATITWTGTLFLDTASNFYFVTSGSTLVGAKTVLFSLL